MKNNYDVNYSGSNFYNDSCSRISNTCDISNGDDDLNGGDDTEYI